jgi:hypothetical protein
VWRIKQYSALTNNLICYEDIAPRGVHEDENEPVEVDVMKEEQQPNLKPHKRAYYQYRNGLAQYRYWYPFWYRQPHTR